MKKFTLYVVLLLVVVLVVASGCDPNKGFFDPWDNLGGGSAGKDVTDYSDEKTADYLVDGLDSTSTSADYDTSAQNCYQIDLDDIALADLSAVTAYSFADNQLTINSGGVFVLTGTLRGSVVVSDTAETVQLVLAGVDIATLETQNCAAIVFKKPSSDTVSERVLTIAEGTTNTLADSVGDNADGDGAVIQAKKRALVVNGTGALKLNCLGEETSGLKVKTSLLIDGTTIEVTGSNKSGIKADQQLVVKNANITINSNGDGIKTDMEPANDEEAKTYASDINYGYLYIENCNLDITALDDGISANNCLYIANTAENTIKVTTNGGAPSTVTELSSDNADGKAIKSDGIEFNDTTYPATFAENYGLIITGGNFELNSNDDAITSKGNLLISGGTFNIASGDDGIHAEYLTKISGGNITVTKSYEAVEGATVEILGGTLDLTAVDDGINAANSDLGNYGFYILVTGGDIFVNAGGDGVDSNGTVKVTGGNLYIYGPTNGANASLDSETGVIITGGNVVAVGAAGMVENPSSNSTQYYVSLTLSATASANTKVTVQNSNGDAILELTPTKTYQSVIISLSEFVQGETYTITVGESSYSATLSNIGTALGQNMQGGGNQGFMPGGPGRPGGR